MSDTVELLEAIGRDASLRRATPEELATVLEANDASAGLRDIVATGDASGLTEELGLQHMHVEHQSQTGGHEGEGDDHHHHHHPDGDHGDDDSDDADDSDESDKSSD